jgi:streptogramin lyase
LWIGQSNGKISRFDPVTETFTEFIMPNTLSATPRVEDIVYQDARSIWLTMPDGNRVVSYDSVRDRFFGVPTGELQPLGLTFDPSGRLWVTTYGSHRIGRYTPTTVSTWVWYDTPTPQSNPAGILAFVDEAGLLQVWVTESGTGTIGRLSVINNFEVINSEKLGPNSPPGNTWGIIRASNGHIWVADTGRNLLYEITEPYIFRTYIASIEKEQAAGN